MKFPSLATIADKARKLVEPKMKDVAQKATRPVRQVGKALLAGVAGGILSGIVKLGWEVPFPPRTPERNETNPPQALLQKFGVPREITHLTYTFSDVQLPIVSFIMHFGFSLTCALIYCLGAEFVPGITLWQGAVFGIAVDLLFHVLLMPALKVVPAAKDQPWEEHASEFFGHIVWMWSIEMVRRAFVGAKPQRRFFGLVG